MSKLEAVSLGEPVAQIEEQILFVGFKVHMLKYSCAKHWISNSVYV